MISIPCIKSRLISVTMISVVSGLPLCAVAAQGRRPNSNLLSLSCLDSSDVWGYAHVSDGTLNGTARLAERINGFFSV